MNLERQLHSPEFAENPYPVYQQLRANAPVYWCEPWNCWIISRYDDVLDGLRQDGRRFSVAGQFGAALNALPEADRPQFQTIKNHFSVGLLHSDPPDHTRLRAMINRAFTPRVVAGMQAEIEAIVEALLDEVASSGRNARFRLPLTRHCHVSSCRHATRRPASVQDLV